MAIVTGPGDMQGVQVPDMVGNYARIMQLRNEMQNAPLQRQALQQQVQAGQLENQQRQAQVNNQQAITQAYQKWDGKDYGGLAHLALQAGATGDAVQALQQHGLALRETASKIASQDAETGSKIVATTRQQNQAVAGALQGILNAPDAQMPQMLISTAQQLSQQKKADGSPLLDPQHLQLAQTLAQQGPSAIKQGLPMFQKDLLAFDQQLEATQKQAQTGEASARANEATVNAQLAPAKLASQQANEAVQRKQGQQRISIEQARLAFEQKKASLDQAQSGLTGEDFLKTLTPGMQAQVKVTANGDIAMPPAGTRNPQAQQMRTAVLTYDPTYTDARYKGKQNFKTSGDAQNIVQLSTAMEHADRAISNSAQVGFAPALGSKTFESPGSAAYMQDAEFLTGEVGKLVKNGVLTVDESNKISSGLTSARQSVRDAALNETMDLLGGKARSVFQKYKTSTGQDLPTNEFFDGKTQQRLTKYGITEGGASGGAPAAAGGLTVKAPNGKTYTFKDQASADSFKQKAGIQ